MKLLLDANLSPRLIAKLESLYPGSSHVDQLGLRDSADTEIWEHAKANGYAIASKDDDFQQQSAVHGHPPKVILIQTGNCSTNRVLELLRTCHPHALDFDADDSASLLVLH
jgi:predicted nuclease of predicted toxin-antitoxin system